MSKWEELFQTIQADDFTLFAVPETHLRDLEEPPPNAEWHWEGYNRTVGSRKGGGVGVLWRSNTTSTRLEGPCNEHKWISCELLGMPVLVGVVYLSVARAEDTGNCRTIECIKKDVIR
ncbi:hypothetical protein MRX96_004696 [Rhipicephalus microplus]